MLPTANEIIASHGGRAMVLRAVRAGGNMLGFRHSPIAVAIAALACGADPDVPRDAGADASRDAGSFDAGTRDAQPTPEDGGNDARAGDTGVDDAGCAIDCVPTNLARDILSTSLALDLEDLSGEAVIRIAGSLESSALSFEIGDLTITSVSSGDTELIHEDDDGVLDIAVPSSAEPIEITIAYTFRTHSSFDGWDPGADTSFLWPTFCGNLYPCHSDPSDGSTFEMTVTGTPKGATVIFPTSIPTEAPSYMPAIALGSYEFLDLGATTDGTGVGVYYFAATETVARAGTEHLREYVDFFEQTYGEYAYGDRVASVEAVWGPGSVGGMEHHPFWHVARGSMGDRETHAHEAAHGWFGNGIRIACWEDFVLSEGLATYLAARAIEAADGETAADEIWEHYQSGLEIAVAFGDTVALPDETCNEIDLLTHELWSNIPYYKGAMFMRAVENAIGRDVLDGALARFYEAHVGRAARMQELIDAIEAESGLDASALEDAWLRSLGIPE
jgi:aminopeptidase N